MSIFAPIFRNELQSPSVEVARTAAANEFDSLSARLSGWALVEHNDDGTHNFNATGYELVPVGGIILWPNTVDNPPSGTWFRCDGTALTRANYPELYRVIGITFGAGDGSTTFNLPDLTASNPTGMVYIIALGAVGAVGLFA